MLGLVEQLVNRAASVAGHALSCPLLTWGCVGLARLPALPVPTWFPRLFPHKKVVRVYFLSPSSLLSPCPPTHVQSVHSNQGSHRLLPPFT